MEKFLIVGMFTAIFPTRRRRRGLRARASGEKQRKFLEIRGSGPSTKPTRRPKFPKSRPKIPAKKSRQKCPGGKEGQTASRRNTWPRPKSRRRERHRGASGSIPARPARLAEVPAKRAGGRRRPRLEGWRV